MSFKDDEIQAFLTNEYEVPSVDLSALDIAREVIALLPAPVVHKYRAVPIDREGSTLVVAMSDGAYDHPAIGDISAHTRLDVTLVQAETSAIDAAIQKYY